MSLTFRTFNKADVEALDRLLQAYTRAYPPRTSPPAQFYLSPYFDGGRNVFCAFDDGGQLVGYAPFLPQGDHAWAEVMAYPGLEDAQLKPGLWAWLLDQARQGGQERLFFQYYPIEEPAIRFVNNQGGQYRYSIFAMRRDLSRPIPSPSPAAGFTLRLWRMESEAEQRQYLEGRNACFPEAFTSLEEWQYFTRTPLWEQGVNLAAFAGDQLAASVLVFWPPDSSTGSTEYVFTMQGYRGRGLARALLIEALNYLKKHGLKHASLEVRAGNSGALGVYTRLGYEVEGESRVYLVELP